MRQVALARPVRGSSAAGCSRPPEFEPLGVPIICRGSQAIPSPTAHVHLIFLTFLNSQYLPTQTNPDTTTPTIPRIKLYATASARESAQGTPASPRSDRLFSTIARPARSPIEPPEGNAGHLFPAIFPAHSRFALNSAMRPCPRSPRADEILRRQ